MGEDTRASYSEPMKQENPYRAAFVTQGTIEGIHSVFVRGPSLGRDV